ncbi:hypothetical protein [Acetilactobacillus jinshanensis]|uniref:Uncharacterized protein n=1 Tax=Acetilactobacillus jinshanensis TaxID=1720083 RepID=A0A4P6ZKV6_9LACO|nr:hypothetical protein [Acetilactobacillus jinshanensis]QBP18288.1 hypothetical protein ELX58_03870 [Acetilactobacillus jinshanensis]URL61152.1 hypothetical protein HGK75_03925 [uncultured bacterium]
MNSEKRKRQIELDTALVITNRILDVVIMFLSIFAFTYFCNHQFGVSLILIILDAIIIPINNGYQVFHYIHDKIQALKSDL